MNRFTTPHFIFTLPFDTSQIKRIRVYFEQAGELILKKTTEHCHLEGKEIKTRLSQEETALFDCTQNAKVQLHILTNTDEAMLSTPYNIFVGECLGDEVLS